MMVFPMFFITNLVNFSDICLVKAATSRLYFHYICTRRSSFGLNSHITKMLSCLTYLLYVLNDNELHYI